MGQKIPAQSVNINACKGCGFRGQILGQECRNHAGEYITHAAAGHAGVSRGTDEYGPVRASHKGLGSLEHQDNFVFFCKVPGGFHSVLLNLRSGFSGKTGHFTWVGGKDHRGLDRVQNVRVFSNAVQAVGVNDHGYGCNGHNAFDQFPGAGIRAYAGS